MRQGAIPEPWTCKAYTLKQQEVATENVMNLHPSSIIRIDAQKSLRGIKLEGQAAQRLEIRNMKLHPPSLCMYYSLPTCRLSDPFCMMYSPLAGDLGWYLITTILSRLVEARQQGKALYFTDTNISLLPFPSLPTLPLNVAHGRLGFPHFLNKICKKKMHQRRNGVTQWQIDSQPRDFYFKTVDSGYQVRKKNAAIYLEELVKQFTDITLSFVGVSSSVFTSKHLVAWNELACFL